MRWIVCTIFWKKKAKRTATNESQKYLETENDYENTKRQFFKGGKIIWTSFLLFLIWRSVVSFIPYQFVLLLRWMQIFKGMRFTIICYWKWLRTEQCLLGSLMSCVPITALLYSLVFNFDTLQRDTWLNAKSASTCFTFDFFR